MAAVDKDKPEAFGNNSYLTPERPLKPLDRSPPSDTSSSVFSNSSSDLSLGTPDTDITGLDSHSSPSPEDKPSSSSYFNVRILPFNKKHIPSTPEPLDDDNEHSKRNPKFARHNGTASDGSPSKGRAAKPEKNKRENPGTGTDPSSEQDGEDSDTITVYVPEEKNRRSKSCTSSGANEPRVKLLPKGLNGKPVTKSVRPEEKTGSKRYVSSGPQKPSDDTQPPATSPDGRRPVEASGLASDRADVLSNHKKRKSRAKSGDDLLSSAVNMPSPTATDREILPPGVADGQSGNSLGARPAQQQVFQAPKSSRNLEEGEEEGEGEGRNPTVDPIDLSGLHATRQNLLRSECPDTPVLASNPVATNLKDRLFEVMTRQNCSREEKDLNKITEGYVYILVAEEYNGLVKIGQTRRTIEARRLDLTRKCRINIRCINGGERMRFMHYQVVEKLVHAELQSEREIVTCKCKKGHQMDKDDEYGVKHGEWFRISEDKAREVVNRWQRWIVDHDPYHKPLCVAQPYEYVGHDGKLMKPEKPERDLLILREFWNLRRIRTITNVKIETVEWDRIEWMWLCDYLWYSLRTGFYVNPSSCFLVIGVWFLLQFGMVVGPILFVLAAVCFAAFRYHTH